MKQLIQDLRSREARVEELPPPSCQAGGILVRNVASLISSGTERAVIELGRKTLVGKALERPDLVRRVWQEVRTSGLSEAVAKVRARLDSAIPLGYSAAGIVHEVGTGVEEFTVGERVACAGAGYACHGELVWVPKNLSVPMPKGVDFESAAAVAVGGIALQGVRLADARVGERVAVIGLGVVGLLTVQILKAAGCRVWGLDTDPERIRLAKEVGADATCENRFWRESPWEASRGADAVIITAATRSAEPIELAGRLARAQGVVVVVGDVRVEVPRESYYKKELQVRYSRSYGPGRYDVEYEEKGHDYPYGYVRWTEKRNMEAFLELVATQKVRVSPLMTHRFDIEQAVEAYRLLSGERQEHYVGILLSYPKVAQPQPQRLTLQAVAPLVPISQDGRPRMRVGWIGAGAFSRAKLLPLLRKSTEVELVGVVNSTAISARQVAREFGFRYCATDFREILDDPAIDVVFIGTRHHLHGSLVTAALGRGKHVFVEKPLCVNEGELEQISEAYARSGRGVAVGFNRRFSPFAQDCRRFFANRREPLSILYRVNAGRLPAGHWVLDPEQGHGRVVGEVCHFVDLIAFLSESPPVEVQAEPVGDLAGGAEDNLHIHLKMGDGSRAEIIYLSSGNPGVPKEYVEVFGGGRTAVCEDYRRYRFYSQNRCQTRATFRQDKGHKAELRAFTEAVTADGTLPIPFESLHATTLATFRIRESLHGGKALPVCARDSA
jgi:predicted dehydrogenase/threonine dehydrogenase-like Zn-dependent dehydrogenase